MQVIGFTEKTHSNYEVYGVKYEVYGVNYEFYGVKYEVYGVGNMSVVMIHSYFWFCVF